MNPVIAMLIGVVVMMVLVICTRMHAFPSLIISAILIAVLSGNYLLVGTGNEGGNLLSVAISTVTGGFGGTIQAFVPLALLETYKNAIDAVFGAGSCHVLSVRNYGAVMVTPDM